MCNFTIKKWKLTSRMSILYTGGVENEQGHLLDLEIARPEDDRLVSTKSPETTRIDWGSGENLGGEWDRQSRLLARRFAEKRGLSIEDYIEEIKGIVREFIPIPESFRNIDSSLLFPILVDPRVALSDLLESDVDLSLAKSRQPKSRQPREKFEHLQINSFFDLGDLEDWNKGDFQTPKKPYATWVTYVSGLSVEDVRTKLLEDQRGGTVHDRIMFYFQQPDILNKHFLWLPGSQVGLYAPFLSASPSAEGKPNHPSLHTGWTDQVSPKYACLITSKL